MRQVPDAASCLPLQRGGSAGPRPSNSVAEIGKATPRPHARSSGHVSIVTAMPESNHVTFVYNSLAFRCGDRGNEVESPFRIVPFARTTNPMQAAGPRRPLDGQSGKKFQNSFGKRTFWMSSNVHLVPAFPVLKTARTVSQNCSARAFPKRPYVSMSSIHGIAEAPSSP